MRDSRCDTGLIIGYRDRYLRNALSQRFEHGVQPGMGNTDRGALQQLQLWSLLYNDRIVRDRTDLLGIDLITYGKYDREGSHVFYSYPRYFIFSFAINDCFGVRTVEPQYRAEPYFHEIRGL